MSYTSYIRSENTLLGYYGIYTYDLYERLLICNKSISVNYSGAFSHMTALIDSNEPKTIMGCPIQAILGPRILCWDITAYTHTIYMKDYSYVTNQLVLITVGHF